MTERLTDDGVWGDPLGEEYDPLGVHLDDPHAFYERARKAEPIFFSPALNAWVVTRLSEVRRVLRDGATFSSANTLRPFAPLSPRVLAELAASPYPPCATFIEMDGEPHRRLRSMVAAPFAPERVAEAEPYIAERAAALAGELAAECAAHGRADFMERFAGRLPVDVICRLVGIPAEESEQVGADGLRAASLTMAHRFAAEDEQVEAARAQERLRRLIARHVRARLAEPRDDLIGAVTAACARGEDGLTPDREAAAVDLIFGVVLPGHITTSAMLGNGLLRLLTHRDQWRLLCERRDLLPNAVEEIARYDTPTHVFLRVTTRDAIVAGRYLPAGTEIAVWLAAANRDEEAFPGGEEFDVSRSAPAGHVTFGYGAHYCLGAPLARLQTEVALRVLTERLPELRLVPGQRIAYRPTLDHRGPLALQVTRAGR
ncbi:cytochrome P450 [Actinomadura miaoliensis]|uniref:Cytochrome P450 n=1 Tax=Actinomadura miaoliensis TaxID=430685 RepID=A0ABP7VBH5_9ACTN